MKKLIIFLIALLLPLSAFTADVWEEGAGNDVISGSDSPSDIDTLLDTSLTEPISRLTKNFRQGALISYSSSSELTVSSGEIVVSNSDGSITAMLSNSSSTTVAWSDLDTGSENDSTTYYLYAYCNDPTSDTDFDVAISTSSSAPSGITYYQRLGSFYNDSSSDIKATSIDNDDELEFSNATSEFVYDSGWFSCSTGGTYTKTHDLGTNTLLVVLYYATDSSGSNMSIVDAQITDGNHTQGATTKSITSTQLTVQAGAQTVYKNWTTSGSITSGASSGYYRVIAIALD